MDSYPGDLLAGVFPLVFAVDSILPSDPAGKQSEARVDDEGLIEGQQEHGPDDVEQDGTSRPGREEGQQPSPTVVPVSTRSLFDRFLDAVAASLVEEESSPRSIVRNGSDTLASFMRGEDEDSSDDDDASLDSPSKRSFRKGSPMPSFRHAKRVHSPTATSYARALKVEPFFQRARVLSISSKHGFPPSKDPDGTHNRAFLLAQSRSTMAMGATGANALRLKTILENHPVDGILPAGWLEKHVHALPSVLLVVTSLSTRNGQDQQDQHFIDTLENLQDSLASKRECHVHVVCLVDDSDMSPQEADEWVASLRDQSSLHVTDITLLTFDDLQVASGSPGMPTSPVLTILLKTVREASFTYYVNQARRAKRKHGILGHERQPNLLPLAARYCFKIAVFYEFQLKHEKSTKFFAEAYRHVDAYYRYLIIGATPQQEGKSSMIVNPQGDDIEMRIVGSDEDDPEEEVEETMNDAGIEVSLAVETNTEDGAFGNQEGLTTGADPPPADAKKLLSELETPDDMTHQCRAVADWLNFKLIQAGFLSSSFAESPDGMLAASSQWRRHTQVFLKRDRKNPAWNHWSYVAHQRLVMSQLVERHKPRPSEEVTPEVLMRCSPWRNYEAAIEAILRLGVEIRKEHKRRMRDKQGNTSEKPRGRSLRQRYIGGLDSEGLTPKMQEEERQQHADKALHMALRAILIFENEKEAMDENFARMFCVQGVRLYYLAGGLLLGMDRFEEAIPHLEKAARYTTGWNALESAIRRMLNECYDKCLSIVTSEKPSTAILNSYFYDEVSSSNLRRALDHFASLSGGNNLKWHCECMDESDASLPFSFAVTFPGSTHATAGDTVTASVLLKSNFDYAVHINSVTLLSMAGHIGVPSNDLLSAMNASEGSDGGIVVQANAAILFSTQVKVPRDLNSIAQDDGASGGETQGTAGKGSFAKSARPRTAGITSAAGARFLSEQALGKAHTDRGAQWSLNYLGGKSLRCDGICIVFAPVYTESAAAHGSVSNVKFIELSIERKKATVAANIKRTPVEEDNYVASTWSRPTDLPLSRGPRCLRVLGPMPQMTVTNMTDPLVNGKFLEGTVNRVLLKLQAGANEVCHDVKYRVTCSSVLLSADGTSKNLNSDNVALSKSGDAAGINRDNLRTPVIVSSDPSRNQVQSTEYGYDLPIYWSLVGTGQGTHDEVVPAVSTLKADEATYISFELYRPPRDLQAIGGVSSLDSQGMTHDEDMDMCQTDFDIAITYRQERPTAQNGKNPSQQQKEIGSFSDGGNDLSDLVFLEHSGSIIWASPLSVEFSRGGAQKAFPSGSRHPSNHCDVETDEKSDKESVKSSENLEIALIDGERVSTRCTIQATNASDGLGVEIAKIRFEDSVADDEDPPAKLSLVSDCRESGLLYTSTADDPTRKLMNGSKFCVTYTVDAAMNTEYKKGSVSARLGVICVDWLPVAIPLPSDIVANEAHNKYNVYGHGPLALRKASTIKFRGPRCYIEDAPFESVLQSLPHSPRVGTPFEMSYHISNKTGVHQKLFVVMSEPLFDEETSNFASAGILVSGLVNGEIRLAPFETQALSYVAIATRAGKTAIPALSVSSDRYKTWVIKSESPDTRQVFVLP